MSKQYNELIVGLDIGTAKVTCMVAEVKPDGRLNVVGLGTQSTNGLKRGVVVNIEATVDAISRVVQEVELMADCKIHEVSPGWPAATSRASTPAARSRSRRRRSRRSTSSA